MHLPAYVTKRKLSSGQFLGFNSPRFTRQTHSLHLLPGENCPVDSFWVWAGPGAKLPPGANMRQPAAGRKYATTGLFGGVARRKYATTGRRAQTCDNRPPGAQVRQPAHGGNYAQTHFEHFFRLRLQLCFSRLLSSQSQSYMECSRYRCCLKERPLRGCRRTSPLRPRPH